jgi:3-oxoacyl-[acyl-carrier protein] reductase
MSLEGHVALVTGGNRNIGRAIVLELAARGCAVVVNASRSGAEAEAVADDARRLGVKAIALLGDVGRAEDVRRLAERALAAFGNVDVLVNNAAIRPEAPFLSLTDEDWHRVLDVDLSAAFYTAKAFLPGMVAQGWGRIVNLTGMNAMQGYVGRAHVSAAKHGVWGSPRRWRASSGRAA